MNYNTLFCALASLLFPYTPYKHFYAQKVPVEYGIIVRMTSCNSMHSHILVGLHLLDYNMKHIFLVTGQKQGMILIGQLPVSAYSVFHLNKQLDNNNSQMIAL